MPYSYILRGQEVIRVNGEVEVRARTIFQDRIGAKFVSTVFVGISHEPRTEKPPLVFKTIIFDDSHSCLVRFYSSWDEAALGHKLALDRARKSATVADFIAAGTDEVCITSPAFRQMTS